MNYNLKAFSVEYTENSRPIKKTLALLASSDRAMPGHFCDNGLGIKWKHITEVDNLEMGHVAWREMSGTKQTPGLSSETITQYALIGENLMAGSFILTKLSCVDLIPELKDIIIDAAKTIFANSSSAEIDALLDNANVYFSDCMDYGYMRARTIIIDNNMRQIDKFVLRPIQIIFILLTFILLFKGLWLWLLGCLIGLCFLGVIGSKLHPLQSFSDLIKGPLSNQVSEKEINMLPEQKKQILVSHACTKVGILVGVAIGIVLWLGLGMQWYFFLLITPYSIIAIGALLKTIFKAVEPMTEY